MRDGSISTQSRRRADVVKRRGEARRDLAARLVRDQRHALAGWMARQYFDGVARARLEQIGEARGQTIIWQKCIKLRAVRLPAGELGHQSTDDEGGHLAAAGRHVGEARGAEARQEPGDAPRKRYGAKSTSMSRIVDRARRRRTAETPRGGPGCAPAATQAAVGSRERACERVRPRPSAPSPSRA